VHIRRERSQLQPELWVQSKDLGRRFSDGSRNGTIAHAVLGPSLFPAPHQREKSGGPDDAQTIANPNLLPAEKRRGITRSLGDYFRVMA